MATIKKTSPRKYGKPYVVDWSWYDDTGKRHFGQERFRTMDEARSKKLAVENAIAGSAPPPGAADRKKPFSLFAERWIETKVRRKPSTVEGYRRLLDGSVLPAFGTRRIRSITTDDVQAFIDRLTARGLSPRTVRRHYNVVRQVLQEAVRQKAIAVNPAVGVELPNDDAVAAPEPVFLTVDEVERLAKVLDSEPPYGLMVRFIAYTGLRAGEVAGLNIRDIDMLRSRVMVRRTRRKVRGAVEEGTPKSHKPRAVPMDEDLRADLIDYLDGHPHRTNPDAPLWPGRTVNDARRFKHSKGSITYDRPWDRDAFYRRWFKPALKTAGLPERTRLHDLRHTYASICASAGVPLYRVADYLGHATDQITKKVYTHLFDTDASDDMARVSELRRKASAAPAERGNVRELRAPRDVG